MKAFVFGAAGLIGNYIYREFKNTGECAGSDLGEFIQLDIRDNSQIAKLSHTYSPQVVVNAAAIGNADYCESHPQESREVNIRGAKNIIEFAKAHRAKLVYLSSDYVFDGKAGPYSEEDTPNPINEYGKQKVEMEDFIKKCLDDYLIIRTTVVYGWEKAGKNFVMNVMRHLKNGKKIKVPTDQIGSPTYAGNLAAAIRELVLKEKKGLYNIVGQELMSRYDFSKLICKIFGLDLSLVIPVDSSELSQAAKRPLKAGLKTDKLKNELMFALVGAEKGLKSMKAEMQCEAARVRE
jgi:dTDP-4-dehydrorhamnose reductase